MTQFVFGNNKNTWTLLGVSSIMTIYSLIAVHSLILFNLILLFSLEESDANYDEVTVGVCCLICSVNISPNCEIFHDPLLHRSYVSCSGNCKQSVTFVLPRRRWIFLVSQMNEKIRHHMKNTLLIWKCRKIRFFLWQVNEKIHCCYRKIHENLCLCSGKFSKMITFVMINARKLSPLFR